MRFRLTIFLLMANAVLFLALWTLERDPSAAKIAASETVPFTTLEISGKTIEKPRVVKLENNKWRIVSPIDWPANLFAVNRIRNQLEFLDKEASFAIAEVTEHGHTLAEYGLDDPAYVFRYGNGEKMYTLKIGKSAPIGDRIYMLDENNSRIIVVDKEFVDSLVVDMERLRNQLVFDIPRFEVSAFSIRLPAEESKGSLKANFRRIGLARDGGKWKFETPIVADADPNEVDAFLNEICQISARSFVSDPSSNTGFDMSSLPITIAIEGTNRRQVLLLGGKTKDGSQIYARLEDNPTIFTLDASIFANLSDIQTELRDKSLMKFDVEKIGGIDISRGGKTLKFRKLKNGVWDVIGEGSKGETLTSNADLAAVSNLLLKLSKVRVRQFVSDAPGDNVAPYGISQNALRIVGTQADQTSFGITVGSEYDSGGAQLRYARVDGSEAVYGISRELFDSAGTDFLRYRSRILDVLPEKASVDSVKISDIRTGKVVFEISSKGGDFSEALSRLDSRKAAAAKELISSVKKFVVRGYVSDGFDKAGVKVDGPTSGWVYLVDASIEVPGTAETVSEHRKWLFTKRFGGTTQYGGSEKASASFLVPTQLVDALFELVQEGSTPDEIQKPRPVPPAKN